MQLYLLYLIEQVLTKNGLLDAGDRIYNCDESGVNSKVQSHEKVYGVVGEPLYQEKVGWFPSLKTYAMYIERSDVDSFC